MFANAEHQKEWASSEGSEMFYTAMHFPLSTPDQGKPVKSGPQHHQMR